MKVKYKVLLTVIGLLLVGTILIGSSYAKWIYTASQSGSNVLNADCFELSFSGINDINLQSAIPLSEEEGSELTPYTFTIKNICNHSARYDINIETMTGSSLDTNYIRYKLNNKNSKILGIAKEVNSLVDKNAIKSNRITSDIIDVNEEKTYDLRLWIDEDSTVDESANKTYESKVVVIASQNDGGYETMLVSGPQFNKIIKQLAGDRTSDEFKSNFLSAIEEYENDPINHPSAYLYKNYRKLYELDNDAYALEVDDTIRKIKIATSMANVINQRVVSSLDSFEKVYAWYSGGVIYLYSNSDTIYLNKDSDGMFSNLVRLTDIDMSAFDTTYVESTALMFAVDYYLNTIDLSQFNTKSLVNMSGMFINTSLTEINLSTFDTSNVTDMSALFFRSAGLKSIVVDTFDTSKVEDSREMFNGCESLVGGNGTTYTEEHKDKEYARVDDPDNGKPGYFTSSK